MRNILILGLIVGILICFGIPIICTVLLARGKKGCWKAFFFGVLAFTISQICIRIPIITMVLPDYAWFTLLQTNLLAYSLFLGLTAGIFEECARWIGMRFLKERTICSGLTFGLGHGGIEAMTSLGLNCVTILVMTLMGKGALFYGIQGNIWIGSVERIFAITYHVGASLLIMHGFRVRKSGRFLVLAILLHTALDMGAVVLGTNIMAVEVYAALIALVTLTAGLGFFRRESQTACEKAVKKPGV